MRLKGYSLGCNNFIVLVYNPFHLIHVVLYVKNSTIHFCLPEMESRDGNVRASAKSNDQRKYICLPLMNDSRR